MIDSNETIQITTNFGFVMLALFVALIILVIMLAIENWEISRDRNKTRPRFKLFQDPMEEYWDKAITEQGKAQMNDAEYFYKKFITIALLRLYRHTKYTWMLLLVIAVLLLIGH